MEIQMMTITQKIDWCKINANKTVEILTSPFNGKRVRIIGYREKTGDVVVEGPECNGQFPGFTYLVPVSNYKCGLVFSIDRLLLVEDYKVIRERKLAEIKRLEEKLTPHRLFGYGPLMCCLDNKTKEKIEARIEELELSGNEPYIPEEV